MSVFFVLNTGRAGSRTVAQTLSQAPDCLCLHEPEPRLIEESVRFRYSELPLEDLVARLRHTRPQPTDGEQRGEANNRLALVVPALTAAFPEARYLWLVRDGRDVVASAVQRGWYSEAELGDGATPWQRWRLRGDLAGVVPPETWRSWDAFERNCWLWRHTNDLIQHDLASVDPGAWMTVRIETLPSQLPQICSHLRITPTSFVVGRANRRREDGPDGAANTVERLSTWHDWSDEQRRVFDHHAGSLMDQLYPQWRDDDGWYDIPSETEDAPVMVTSPQPVEDAQSTDGTAVVSRVELAELRILRGELNAIRRVMHQAERRAEDERGRAHQLQEQVRGLEKLNGELTLDRERAELRQQDMTIQYERAEVQLQDMRIQHDRLEHEVSRAQKDAEAHRQRVIRLTDDLHAVKRDREAVKHDRDRWREKHDSAKREAVQARRRAAALERRWPRRLARAARQPATALRRALLAVLRTLAGRLPHDARRWLLVQSERHLPAHVDVRLRSLNRRIKATGRQATPHSSPRGSRRDTTPAIHSRPGHSTAPMRAPAVLSDDLPVLGYVMLGLTDAQLIRIVRDIRRSALSTGHVPLVITDSDAFSLLREEGVAFEHIPSQEAWQRHRPDLSWADLLVQRVARVVEDHRCDRVITIIDPDDVDFARLSALVDA